MAVNNRCNATELVLQRLGKLYWGFKCKDTSLAIVERYIQFLNCPDINLTICSPENKESECENEPTIFNCNFNVIAISSSLNSEGEEDIIFHLGITDYVGATLPLTYLWTYDTDDFDLLGGTNNTSSEIKLVLKEGKQVELLVSKIKVEITDANGCRDTKECYLIPGGIMKCNSNFVPCNNPVDLDVSYIYTSCSKPKSLVVSIGTPPPDDEDNLMINGSDALLINGTDKFIL